jgi:hypothetical protein
MPCYQPIDPIGARGQDPFLHRPFYERLVRSWALFGHGAMSELSPLCVMRCKANIVAS